jgi:salicylate hydroxylase
MNLKMDNKFNPKRIDFYSLKNNNKICELNIAQFNRKNISYTTIKRSLLIEFLKEKLFTNSIQFNKKIEKINYINSKIEITFENNNTETFDYLVIADGVFSLTKSFFFNNNIKQKYSGSLAFRALIKKENIKFLNENSISLFLGPKIHLVIYAVNTKNEFNLVGIVRKNLDPKILNDKNFFKNKENIRKIIRDSAVQKNNEFRNLFNNIKDIKCFPTFISDKILQPELKNVFFLGDAFYSPLPTFAQGASQSIESAYELFNTLNENNINKYFNNRKERIKMINRRSKLNYHIFHLSNPFCIFIRNFILKIVVNNKSFLNKYLGQIYSRN